MVSGFPRYFLEIIQSTPAVADVNDDGEPEIFVGTGSFYRLFSPDHPTAGFRVFGLDRFGKDLPGWEGGQPVGNIPSGSPAIGNIAGDSEPEIVMAVKDQMLYAWHVNGQPVSGFPMKPVDRFGNGFPYASSLVLADYDGDQMMEIIVNQATTIAVVDGDGEQLTRSPSNPSLPDYRTYGANRNTPAVADLDGNGTLELIAHNSTLYAWELTESSTAADWPMFKRNAPRTSYVPIPPHLGASTTQLVASHVAGDTGPASVVFSLFNSGDLGTVTWSAQTPGDVALTPSSGVLSDTPVTVEVEVDTSGYGPGLHNLGNIVVTGKLSDPAGAEEKATISVSLFIFESKLLLPIVIHD
jgi:hypothetical protein